MVKVKHTAHKDSGGTSAHGNDVLLSYPLLSSQSTFGSRAHYGCTFVCFLLLISASRRGGSDDSQEELHPRKHARKRPVIEESSSAEGFDYEEEMEEEERGVQVTFRPAPRFSKGHSHACSSSRSAACRWSSHTP